MVKDFKDFFRNKNILITGHTGFKGSWLLLILLKLKANVWGFSLEPDAEPNLFRSLDQEIKSGEVFGSVEAVKTVSDLFMPITGEIIEINQNIIDNPELINSDPYGEGWMIKIKILDSNEIEDLLDLKSYEEISG